MAVQFPIAVPITAIDRLSGPLGRMTGKLGQFGAAATRAGKTLTLGVTAPIVGFGALAITTAAGFEKSMNRVEALTGAPADAMAVLEQQAKDLGGTTEFSARQAADAMGFLAQSGQDVREIGQTLPPVLQLASAAQLDLATTADLTTNILKGYGKETSEAARVVDVLAEATTKGNTDLVQLSEAMKLAGPVANAFGQEFTTTVAILDKLADAGFQATLGGTALRGAYVKLAEAADKGSPILTKLGITSAQVFDEQGNLRDFADLIELLQERGITATQSMALFGQRAGPAMATLLAGSVDEIRSLADVLENSSGRALEIQQIQLKGAAGEMVNLISRFEALLITISQSGLLDLFSKMVTLLTQLVDVLKATNPRWIKLGLVIAGVAAVVGPLLIALGLAATGIGAVSTAVGFLLPVLGTMATFIVSTAIPAVWSFTAALLANPIGLVVAAIGALILAGVALVKNWDEVKKAASKAWGAIQWGVGRAVDFIKRQIESLVDIMPDWLIKLIKLTNPVGGAVALARAVQGREIGGQRVAAAVTGPGAANATATVGGRIGIEFRNAPPGTTLRQEGASEIPIDVELGPNLAGAAA